MNMTLKDRVELLSKRIFLKLFRSLLGVQVSVLPFSSPFKTILVIRQHDQLGDMLCVVPLLRALRARYTGAVIHLVTGNVNHEIMLNHPYLDDVIRFPRGNYAAMFPFFRILKRRRYDLAIVPSTVSISVTSALIAIACGAPVRIGALSINGAPAPTAPCFSLPVTLDWRSEPHRHQTLRNLDVAAPLALEHPELTTVIGFSDTEQTLAVNALADLRRRHTKLLGVHPGAGKHENRWAAEKFISVINRIAREFPVGIVITFGPQDADLRDRILPSLRCDYLVLDHRPLREVAAIIDQLDCFLANDTGIMHIAGAVRTRLVALFGPSDYLQWMPPGDKNRCVRGSDATMSSIGEEEVYRELSTMLAESLTRR